MIAEAAVERFLQMCFLCLCVLCWAVDNKAAHDKNWGGPEWIGGLGSDCTAMQSAKRQKDALIPML